MYNYVYGLTECIILPQYVLKASCEPEDDWNMSKHVLYSKYNLVVFGQIFI